MAETPKRKRRTTSQIEADRKAKAQVEDARAAIIDLHGRANALRSKERDFHGLDREFAYAQTKMTVDFKQSGDVSHPRDVGAIRESLLRGFLEGNGLLPKRYGLSRLSFRAASTTGHLSQEIDIALIDPLDSFSLMRRDSVFEVLPIESVYGVIQVKSRLNAKALISALDNIKSFKSLNPVRPSVIVSTRQKLSRRGFGMIFAYATDIEQPEIRRILCDFANENPNSVWPNAVTILNVGTFGIGIDLKGLLHNHELEGIGKPVVHTAPDQGNGLYTFYSMLMELLRSTEISPPPVDRYFNLPLIAGPQSYTFHLGAFAELRECSIHGDYTRKIADNKLSMVADWCRTAEPINWIRAMDLAAGRPGDNEEAYARQPGDVRIFNPDSLPLSDILQRPALLQGRTVGALAYDTIDTAGMTIFIPFYYSETLDIISECPACAKAAEKADRR